MSLCAGFTGVNVPFVVMCAPCPMFPPDSLKRIPLKLIFALKNVVVSGKKNVYIVKLTYLFKYLYIINI